MKPRAVLHLLLVSWLAITSLLFLSLTNASAAATADPSLPPTALQHRRVCAAPRAGHATCFARIIVDPAGGPVALAMPTGYGPTQLVEADPNSYYDLMAAEERAYLLGARVISNSWGSIEFDSQDQFDTYLNRPGVPITFSSGDGGSELTFPASSRYVTGIGGTTLTLNADGTYWGEMAWSGTGSGGSAYEAKPSFQADAATCPTRTVVDVAADAEPATGAAIYSSVAYQRRTGWFVIGGTKLAPPLVASVYALGGLPTSAQAHALSYLRGNATNLHDIQSGNNGTYPAEKSYLCTAVAGYNGPTGPGTPNGTAAF